MLKKGKPVVEAAGGELAGSALEKKRQKLSIVAGVLVVTLLVAGAGFWVWHEQPSFCNAICHTPMDPYLPTFEAQPGDAGIDKWGNEVEDAAAMLASTHRVEGDATCMSCHVPTLSEQVAEGFAWIAGDYEAVSNPTYGWVLGEKSLEDLVVARGVSAETFCLNDACHVNADGTVMTRDDLIAATSDMSRNPHLPQHGEIACSDCHKAHRASVNYCSGCHADAELPDGWISSSKDKQLAVRA